MGKAPPAAWQATLEDYAFVHHPDPGDNRTRLARAAQVALKHLNPPDHTHDPTP